MKSIIVKMVNHELTEKQKYSIKGAEIIELPENLMSELKQCGSDITALNTLANSIIEFAKENFAKGFILPGGSPAFNSIFSAKIAGKFDQYFSHSVRDYKEVKNADGSVSKTNVFRHIEWIIITKEVV